METELLSRLDDEGGQEEGLTEGRAQGEEQMPSYEEAFPALPPPSISEHPTHRPHGGRKIRPLTPSIITQVFHLPFSETQVREEGDRAKIFQDIMRSCGARLEVSLAKDRGLSILVTGTREEARRARREIVTRLQTQCVATFPIPKEHHGYLVGRNGQRLRELELLTSTRITLPPPEEPDSLVTVSGSKEGTERARHEILLLSADRDRRLVERVRVEKAFHPFICGPGGRLLVALAEETGARVHVPPPSVAQDEIVVIGDKDGVAQAVSRIQAVYEEKRQTTKTIAVEVRKSQHRYLVGPGGAHLQGILDETGVSVQVPVAESLSETVVLRGELDQLGTALAMVYARAHSVAQQEISAPCWLHRHIIGKQGERISLLAARYPQVHIEFMEGEDRIVLEGPHEDVCLAQAQLQEQVDKLVKEMGFAELKVDPKFFRHLIGRNGANISRIRETYRVTVQFPDEGTLDGGIQIEGSPQNVRGAESELRETVRRLEDEMTKDVIVGQRYHRLLIGPRGETIKDIRSKFPEVVIVFPGPASASEVIQLRGPRAAVQKCAKFLEGQVSELMELNFSLSVSIPRRFHRNVIGRGGSTIRRIREETRTRIEMPREGSEEEVVLIRGRREDCESARGQILALAQAIQPEGALPAPPLTPPPPRGSRSLPSSGAEETASIEGSSGDPLRGEGQEGPQVRVLCQIPRRYHRLIRGARAEQLSRDHGVRVQFPPREPRPGDRDSPSDEGQDAEGTDNAQDAIALVGPERGCSAVQAIIESLVPVSVDVPVPFKLHRFIIGPGGYNIRKMMEEYDVSLTVPPPEKLQDLITISGRPECVERAQAGILEKVRQMEVEQEDRVLRNFQVALSVDPKHHPRVIGRKGGIISQIRSEHMVSIQFPERGAQQPDLITITGYESNVLRARDVIEGMVRGFEDVSERQIALDPRIHSRIIGARGRQIRKIMEDFKVVVRMPPLEERQRGSVTVRGTPDAVDEVIDHLLNLQEEYIADLPDLLPEEPITPDRGEGSDDGGFRVRQAPWHSPQPTPPDVTSPEEFPSVTSPLALPPSNVWAQRRF